MYIYCCRCSLGSESCQLSTQPPRGEGQMEGQTHRCISITSMTPLSCSSWILPFLFNNVLQVIPWKDGPCFFLKLPVSHWIWDLSCVYSGFTIIYLTSPPPHYFPRANKAELVILHQIFLVLLWNCWLKRYVHLIFFLQCNWFVVIHFLTFFFLFYSMYAIYIFNSRGVKDTGISINIWKAHFSHIKQYLLKKSTWWAFFITFIWVQCAVFLVKKQ